MTTQLTQAEMDRVTQCPVTGHTLLDGRAILGMIRIVNTSFDSMFSDPESPVVSVDVIEPSAYNLETARLVRSYEDVSEDEINF